MSEIILVNILGFFKQEGGTQIIKAKLRNQTDIRTLTNIELKNKIFDMYIQTI